MTWPPERSRHGGVDEIPLPATKGRLWICGKHFVGADPDGALRSVGATTMVCLNEEAELAGRYPHYVAWLRDRQPDQAIWWPVPDLHAPDVHDARTLVATLTGRLEAGDRLLMHCGAGIGRAGTLAAALLMAMGVPMPEALSLVAACRPMAGPEAGAQMALLAALDESGGR